MAENFANLYQTTINDSGGISDTDTSVTVTTATGAPPANFRLKCEDELMLVTAVVGSTFTITRGIEGTTATSHADGATVTHVLTAASVQEVGKHASARYIRTAGNYTTTAATFGDIDGTNASFTLTVRANARILMGMAGASNCNNTAGGTWFDAVVDGTRQGGDLGLTGYGQHSTASEAFPIGWSYLTDQLSAGSHTVKWQWRTATAGQTSTLFGSTTSGQLNCTFWAVEIF